MALTLFKRKVESGGLETLATEEMKLTNQLREKRNALSQLKNAAGEALLNGEADGTATEAATRAAVELSAVENALGTLRSMRPDAVRAHYHRQAGEIHKRAQEVQRELDEITAKYADLMGQINTLEGCPIFGVPASNAPPRSRLLAQQLQDLQDQATRLESKSAATAGEVDLEDVVDDDTVVRAVLIHASSGPTATEIYSWLANCEATAKKKFSPGFEKRPRRVRVIWQNSQITAESYVFVPSLAPPTKAKYSEGNSGFDCNAATFKSATA